MNNKVFVFLCAVLFLGVVLVQVYPTKEPSRQRVFVIENKVGDKTRFETVVFDQCEYLYHESYRKLVLTHKGNCRNH